MGLYIGVVKAELRIRQARGLKDKRKIVQSLRARLKNLGFSVCEIDPQDSPKSGDIGFCYCGSNYEQVKQTLAQSERLFIGDFDLVSFDQEVIDFAYERERRWGEEE